MTGNEDEHEFELNLSHPVKELIWCFKDNNKELKTMKSAYITMNGGQKRASERPEIYYRLAQPYNHHTRIPTTKLYMYSFALRPEDPQPSGSCNFSRLTCRLHFRLKQGENATKVHVYATNTNLLRIRNNKGNVVYNS